MTAKPFCDRAQALAATPRATKRPQWVLAVTILASGIDYIDGSVVNVGLPAIGRSLHGSGADLQWVVNAYLLPLSALLLLGGALGDRFGRRRMLITGVALFAAGSAGCAAAPGLVQLILARAVQGLAAAMMLPNSLAILGGAFEGKERGRAVGIWAATGSIAAAIGPVFGGWLIDTVGWRAIFLINLPLAAATIGLALYAIEPDAKPAKGARLDLDGAALATVALAALTWGLTEGSGPQGWRIAPIAAVASALILFAAFVRTERRLGDQAMTPLALFGSKPLVALNLLTLLLYGALGAFLLLLPYTLINAAHWSATAAGAAITPFSPVMAVVSPLAGELGGRFGARRLLIVGALLVAGGLALASLIGEGGSYWTSVLPSVLVVALGMSLGAAPLTAAVLGAVDAHHVGAASGLNSAVAQIGNVTAIALIGGVLGARGPALLDAFHAAAICGSFAAIGAAAAILVLYRPQPSGGQNAQAR